MSRLSEKLASISAKLESSQKEKNEVIQNDTRHEIIENTVTKSNALCRSYYRYGIVEKRCMEAMISQIDSRLADAKQLQEVTLTASDYAKAYNVPLKVAYRDMEKAVEKLMHEVITIHEGNKKIQYTLMAYAEYIEGEGRIVANFNPLISKHLVGLRSKFASYPLEKTIDFKSSYTWRLYELLVSWSQDKNISGGVLAGWFTVEIEEFRKMMGAPKSFQMVHIKDRIIERSKNELLEKANINLEVEYVRKGRKVTHLKFEFLEMKGEVSDS